MTLNQKTILYDFLVRACQEHGFTTDATYESLHSAVDSIRDDKDAATDDPDDQSSYVMTKDDPLVQSSIKEKDPAEIFGGFSVVATFRIRSQGNESEATELLQEVVQLAAQTKGSDQFFVEAHIEYRDPDTGAWRRWQQQ